MPFRVRGRSHDLLFEVGQLRQRHECTPYPNTLCGSAFQVALNSLAPAPSLPPNVRLQSNDILTSESRADQFARLWVPQRVGEDEVAKCRTLRWLPPGRVPGDVVGKGREGVDTR